jgi:hypothetical protein
VITTPTIPLWRLRTRLVISSRESLSMEKNPYLASLKIPLPILALQELNFLTRTKINF